MSEQERWNKEMEALKADISTLRSDMSLLTEELRDMARARGAGFRHAMNDEVEEARARLREGYEAARAYGRHSVDEVEERIGRNPLASVAAAVGIGFIVAKLMDIGGKR